MTIIWSSLHRRNLHAIALMLLAAAVLCLTLWPKDGFIPEDNHLLETVQAVSLLLACLAHEARVCRSTQDPLPFLVRHGLALLMYSFALRELDIELFGTAPGWRVAQGFFRFAGAALWVGFLIALMPHLKPMLGQRAAILVTPLGAMTLCGSLLLAAGWPLDKALFTFVTPLASAFIEEMLELGACLFFLAASLARDSLRTEFAGAKTAAVEHGCSA